MDAPEVQVRPEDELPRLLEDYGHAIIGIGRQLTDSGVVRNVAIYSQSAIIEAMISEAVEFITAHNGTFEEADISAAVVAAQERFREIVSTFEGPGMPVFAMDMDEGEEDDGQVNDGAEEQVEG